MDNCGLSVVFKLKLKEYVMLEIFELVIERFHNAVEIDILGIFEEYLATPKNISGAKLFRANDVIYIEHVLCS